MSKKKVNGGWATCWCDAPNGIGAQVLYTGEMSFYDLIAATDSWCRDSTGGVEFGSCSVNQTPQPY